MREPKRSDDHRERGAVATIVATLLAGGVIIGMLAVSVDIGNLMYERRQVQNGADATSLALAAECAADESSCGPTQVQDLLGSNAHDDASRFLARPDAPNGVCGRDVDSLPTCSSVDPSTSTASLSELSECPPLPAGLDAGIPYVESYAATQTESGGTELFLPFSRVLVGGASGDAGVSACARAAWGVPAGFANSLPLTFSKCEWGNQTEDGTDFVSEGPVGGGTGYGGAGQPAWPGFDREVVLSVHEPGAEVSTCTTASGKDFPGGFGYLEADSDCEAIVSEDNWVHTNNGNKPPCMSDDVINTVLDIPIYDCFVGDESLAVGVPSGDPDDCIDESAGGNNTWYHLVGWAKFYVSGRKFSGSDSGASTMPGGHSGCPGPGGSGRCIMGWFLTGTLADAPSIAAPGGADDFGVHVIKPVG